MKHKKTDEGYPIFRSYLEEENDKPYYSVNTLSFYYEDMERKQKLIEDLAKAIAGYDQTLTGNLATIEQQVAERFEQWDEKLKTFDGSVMDLLQEWVDDGTMDHIVDSSIVDRKLAPLTAQLAETASEINQMDYVEFVKSHNKVNGKLVVKRRGNRNFEVGIPLANGKYQKHEFQKDRNDDFIKYGEISIARYESSDYLKGKSNFDSLEGSWSTASTNHYTTKVNDKAFKTFTGTGFDIYCNHDSRGGLLSVSIDDGEPIVISTHRNSVINETPVAGALYRKFIIRNLENTVHNVVITFLGADPENPPVHPSTGEPDTARGWLYYDDGTRDNATFDIFTSGYILNYDVITGAEGSNKEFATSMKKWGESYGAPFIPDHGSGTAIPTYQKLLVDNVEMDLNEIDNDYIECDSVQLIQKVNADNVVHNPGVVMAHIYLVHTINLDGVNYRGKMIFQEDTSVGGYFCMFPSTSNFARVLLVSTNDKYPATKTDGSSTDIINGDKAKSFAFINNDGTQNEQNTVYAMTVENISKTFRQGESDRKTPSVLWLQHRNHLLQKLYPHVLVDHYAVAGSTLEFGANIYVGQVEFASVLLG